MTTVDPAEKIYKIVVLGTGAVGKSALTIRLVSNIFLGYYDPTLEDNYGIVVNVDEKDAHLDILDTAGQDEYSQMQDQWMRHGRGIMVCYAIDNLSSFTEIQSFKEKIDRVKETEPYALVLVGNKCDLESTREVSKEQGQALAAKWGCPFLEVSAKANINHDECFFQVTRELRKLDAADAIPQRETTSDCCIIL